jgi:hypothetical protein
MKVIPQEVLTFYVEKIANNFHVFFCVTIDTCFHVFVLSIFFIDV